MAVLGGVRGRGERRTEDGERRSILPATGPAGKRIVEKKAAEGPWLEKEGWREHLESVFHENAEDNDLGGGHLPG